MNTVVSADGTTIAYDRIGDGPPLVLVDGALCYRASGPNGPLAAALAPHFTVYTYDRRGRGDSGNTLPYRIQAEVDDLAALLAEAGGSAHVYGISSGAALALEAANRGVPITRLALYEPPFVVDDSRPPAPPDMLAQLVELIAADRRGDAVKLFMTAGVRVPGVFVMLMQVMPAWSRLKGVAHTLPYDIEIIGDGQQGAPLSPDRWSSVSVPTLVVAGGKSPVWMRTAVRQVADVVPGADYRTLDGQTHLVQPKVLAPVLAEFFTLPAATDAADSAGQADPSRGEHR